MLDTQQHNVPTITLNLYFVLIALLILCCFILGAKYAHLKLAVNQYTQATMMHNMMRPQWIGANDSVKVIADTIALTPSTQPLFTQPVALQEYVTTVSKDLDRDIVVMDTNKNILADTVAANKGTTYGYDAQGEVAATIKDGKQRLFVEKSTDYTQGINEMVYPLKNAQGTTIGALLVSTSSLSQ